ncbi:MAG: hypothetical protein R3C97_12250 [Geminicoccaceae bacterium]
MSGTSNHSCPSPRAFVLLAHHIEEGRSVVEAARMSGMEPALAERLAHNWAFLLLVRIVPFFRVHVRPSSASPSEKAESRRKISDLPPAARRLFSLGIRCVVEQEAKGVDAEDGALDAGSTGSSHSAPAAATIGNAVSKVKPFAGHHPRSSASPALPVEAGTVAASFDLGIEALYAPLVEKAA